MVKDLNLNCVAHWPLSGTEDLSGYGHTLTVTNAVLSTDKNNRNNRAYVFDGTGDYIEAADSTDFDFGTGDFAFSTWIIPTSWTGSWWGPFGWSVSGYMPLLLQANNNGTLLGYVSSNGSSWDLLSGGTICTLTLNVWQHLVIQRVGTNLVCYLNGVAQTPNAIGSTGVMNSPAAIRLGESQTETGKEMIGSLSDFRIYKGRSLSAEEVKQLYLERKQDYQGLFDGCVASWPMDSLFDEVGTKTLTNNGASLTTDRFTITDHAYNFNGTSSYMTAADSDDFNFATIFTVSFWIKSDNTPSNEVFVGQWQETGNARAWVLGYVSNFYFAVSTDGASGTVTSINTGTLTDNVWTHVCGVSDGGNLRLYINGASIGNAGFTGNVYDSTSTVNIAGGSTFAGSTNYFDGSISNISIWKGIGLTAAQVKLLYDLESKKHIHPLMRGGRD
jgi:hypothetical protein